MPDCGSQSCGSFFRADNTNTGESANLPAILALTNQSWRVLISSSNGAVCEINNASYASEMNRIHAQRFWGLLKSKEGTNELVFNNPISVKLKDARTCESLCETDNLEFTVSRGIDSQDHFTETYTLENTGALPRLFSPASTFLTVPFNDSCETGAPNCLTQNCNAHLWAGGGSSWVNAVRMGGMAPHLGLVLTAGSLDGYSILEGGASSNDRGNLAFNPSSFELKPGETYVISWELFWHDGWPDFWSKVMRQPNFVRLQAAHYTAVQEQQIQISADSGSSLENAVLRLNGREVAVTHDGKRLSASIKTDQPGEQTFELENEGQIS